MHALLDAYLTHLTVIRGLSENTVAAYAADVSAFLDALSGTDTVLLEHIDAEIVLAYLASRKAQGVTPRTLARQLSALRGFFAFVEETHGGPNPARLVDSPRIPRKLPAVLSQEDVAALLAAPAVLRERFTRYFGVWREAEGGRSVVFDPLFEQGLELPAPGAPPLRRTRSYSPVHNIGHFRYLECSHRTASGEPAGDITAWDEIRFPFDPRLASVADLENIPVDRSPEAARQWIEEAYMVDSGGSVTVVISNLTAGYRREYRLGQWASAQKTIRRTQPATRTRRYKAGH
jgi:hypothetical protein